MKKEYYYGILPLALTSCLVSQTSAQERQINRPNVVFIYADDIGYGDLRCNGANTLGVRKERELQTEMPRLSFARNVIQWRICSKRQDIVRGW